MCEVKDGGDAGETSIQEDDALEKIFSACDVPSTGRVSVAKLIGYMRDHMSTQGSPEILKDLRTSMCASSYNGEVTREQYHDVSRRWLIKIRKHQHYLEESHQDGNNNLHIDRNSDSLNDRTAELTDGATRIGATPPALTVPVVERSVGLADTRHESDAGSFRGFLDLTTSTVVDDVGISCETGDPYFGNLSSVDGTYHMAVDDPADAETAHDLRLRAHRCALANEHLREELLRAEDSIATLERQLAVNGRKLELVNNKCDRMQREHEEHEEHKELLAAAERDRETLRARNQRLDRDNSLLRKEIAAADAEALRLNAELDRITEQKEEWIRMLAHCQRELIERQAMYDEVKGQVLQMKLANAKLSEEHAISTSATEHLKVVVKELETRITEIQLDQNYVLRGGGLFASPDDDNGPDGDEAKISQDVDHLLPRSLHDEMKATGYNDSEVMSRGDDDENFMGTIEDEQRMTDREYAETILCLATEDLERATAEIAASHKEMGIGLPPAQSPPGAAEPANGVQVHSMEKNGEYYEGTGYLQRFKSQIQHVLTILALLASYKVTNAEMKDAATQLGGRDLVPELRAVCDVNKFNSGGPSGFESMMSRRAESPMSRDAPSGTRNQSKMDVLGSEPEFGDNAHQSYGWRRRESTTTDYTSDDTYDVGSNQSHSTFSEESNCRSPIRDSLTYSPDSLISNEAGGLNRMDKMGIIGATKTHDVELTLASVGNRTCPGDGNRGTADDVEDLNSVLERLTLRTTLSGGEQGTGNNYGGRYIMADARGDPSEHQPHDRLPIRKTSVFYRSFDVCAAPDCEMDQKIEASMEEDIRTTPGGAIQGEEGRSLHPTIKHGIKSTKTNEYPCEDLSEPPPGLGESSGTFATTTDIMTGCVQDFEIHIWPSTMQPNKAEVSPGDRHTKYIIRDNISPPHPTTSTGTTTITTTIRRLPSNHDILGGTASVDSAGWRDDEREMQTRSRSVARAMSSEEDSSDSECTRDHVDREEHAQVAQLPLPPELPPSPLPLLLSQSQTQTQTCPPSVSPPLPPPPRQPSTVGLSSRSAFAFENPLAYNRDTSKERIIPETGQDCLQRRSKNHQKFGRSLSESDTGRCRARAECGCRCRCECVRIPRTENGTTEDEETTDQQRLRVFPNLPDTLLIELGLAVPSDGSRDRIAVDELERKYTALSIGLETDRITLPQRLALSLRQRDQAERNLATEVKRMQRDIQALAPLCVDRESVERVERVRHQLEMISRCTLRVSCTAELLGATHQERRVSRVALLADRYLQAMRARCDKISADLAETKRILTENNIVVEENPNDLGDDIVPRLRYRGVPPTNRTTISRRRASIATISRPALGNPQQEAANKDNGRQQRASVPGRLTLRRPSLGYDTQRWDNEKLDRTDSSSSSIGELREIFEQAESRRGSREENNNLIRSQSSNFSVGTCESGDSDVWASPREDLVSCQAETRHDELPPENALPSQRTQRIFSTIQEHVSRLPISWYILFVAVFFFGFYSNRYVTTRSAAPFKWWSIDEIMKRYVRVQRNVPPPI